MPLFEEKLISPLAIRFTQQRIRSKFKDGHEVEATIKEMTGLPTEGDYDIILDVPFPSIEIIRWCPRGRKSGRRAHWFSFDNRRLYCLQRVATEYWPKRVGARVEVLYADSGTFRKKLDSQSQGLNVTIGHAFATENERVEWSWQKAVQMSAPPGKFTTLEAEARILADDAKETLHDLTDANSGTVATTGRGNLENSTCDSAAASSNTQEREGLTHNSKGASSSQAPPPENQSLTGLIGQLLQLKTDELQQSCLVSEPHTSGIFAVENSIAATDEQHDHPTVAPLTEAANAADDKETTEHDATGVQDDFTHLPEVEVKPRPLESNSLSSLIGQLLELKAGQHSQECRDEPQAEANAVIIDHSEAQATRSEINKVEVESQEHTDRNDLDATEVTAAPVDNQSLTSLIGQLFKLEKEARLSCGGTPAAKNSTHVAETAASSESTEANVEISTLSPSCKSSFAEVSSVSDDDVRAQLPMPSFAMGSAPRSCPDKSLGGQATQHARSVHPQLLPSSYGLQKDQGKVKTKQVRTFEDGSQLPMAMPQLQMSQCQQMSGWHVENAMQLARWQRALCDPQFPAAPDSAWL